MKLMKSKVTWERYVNNFLIPTNKTFQIEETNGVKMVMWNTEKKFGAVYRKQLSPEAMKRMWVFGVVKKQLKKYAKDHPDFPIFEPIPPVKKNKESVLRLEEGSVFYATDASHCYWRMGRNLGYITEGLYDKLIEPEYKLQRNKALACCTSVKKIHYYENGKFIRTENKANHELQALYANIRNASYDMMQSAMNLLREDFIKYKIDCVYYFPEKQQLVESIFMARNMLFKTTECIYIGNGFFIEKDEIKKI